MSRILITGAARGIGAESARRLAQRGHTLALLGLQPEELEAVAAECGPPTAEIERLWEAEIAARGAAEASSPVGAGGAASLK
jgi:short-subunit dehydrogenase